MKTKKRQTFVYHGLGFPIKLVNAPMKKVIGVWVIDLDMEKLQETVLQNLIQKTTPLTGGELKFIRKFLNMTMVEFGKVFGVSHVAIVKWESEQRKVSPPLEICIRLYVLEFLHAKDKEFRSLYKKVSLDLLTKHHEDKSQPISIKVA